MRRPLDVSPPRSSGSGPNPLDRARTGTGEPSPGTLGPWACSDPANGWDWDKTNRCKAICARCTTRVECAALWLSLPRAQRKYGSGVWAGFDMDDPLERVHLGRWHGKQVRG